MEAMKKNVKQNIFFLIVTAIILVILVINEKNLSSPTTAFSHTNLAITFQYPEDWDKIVERRGEAGDLQEILLKNQENGKGVALNRAEAASLPSCETILTEVVEGSDSYASGCEIIIVGNRNEGRLLTVTTSTGETFPSALVPDPNGIWSFTPVGNTPDEDFIEIIHSINYSM
jgi:hypothetical protein